MRDARLFRSSSFVRAHQQPDLRRGSKIKEVDATAQAHDEHT
jgi:hypothetical protein